MITYHSNSRNHLTQDIYYKETAVLILSTTPCPVCGLCTLIFYGYYSRKLFVLAKHDFINFYIHRLMCKSCRVTHALLPDDFTVRAPLFLHDAVNIFDMNHKELNTFIILNPCFSTQRINSFINRVSSWSISKNIDIFSHSVSELVYLLFPFHLYQHYPDRYFPVLV